MIDFCPSVVYWLSISLRYLQSVHTVRLQSLGVTKQIFRPTEFFPLTITETITDKSTQISIWLNIYLFPSDYRQPWSPTSCSVQLCVATLQTNCDCPYTVLPSPYLAWLGVGGWGQMRPDQIADSSHILQISDPISSEELQQPQHSLA